MEDLQQRLAVYLAEHHPAWGALTSLRRLGAGWEAEIFVFTVAAAPGDTAGVLRLYTSPATAAREPMILQTMAELGYPVPAVWGVERDPGPLGAPFLLMEHVDGPAMDDLFADPEQRPAAEDRFGRLLADLHGLAPRLAATRLGPPSAIRGRLAHWRRDPPPGFEQVVQWLFDRSGSVTALPPSVIHRDFHPGNILIAADGTEKVIDWGHAQVGDRRLDLAWTLLLFTSFDGAQAREAILTAYRSHAGLDLPDLDFFDALAATLRLHHVAASFTANFDASGDVPGMAAVVEGFRTVHDLLEDRTGIRIGVVDRLLAG